MSVAKLKVLAWVAGMQARTSTLLESSLRSQLEDRIAALPQGDALRQLVEAFLSAMDAAARDPGARIAAGEALVGGVRHLALAEAGDNIRRISGE
ncbi:hypothetical protein [Pseudooceanicola algae]|uniref:Uncharacterized protein n=1 Tax=Pseudooceanicola algae TaxID=1537215 RepID=A0A418SKD5_9RHOB|nr:hypothetical protein [Pseudooceanicola algae]QPM89138.1 hypothetical protein PSAL_003490 [Pseudooceanicola algae]